ncbi:MAG: hypothetical protein KDB80_05890, partial [Planctomycetes bacterium]|nr:hypothetical protein [Planctomycetota bacterium]
FPTLVIVSPEGDELARLGSVPKEPAECLAELVAQRDAGLARFARIHALEAALIDDEDTTATTKAAIEFLSSSAVGAPGNARLATIVRTSLALDDEARAAMRDAALRVLFSSGESLPSDRERAFQLDPKNVAGLLELAVEAEVGAVETRQQSFAALDSIDRLIGLPLVDPERGRKLFANAARWADRARDDAAIRGRAPRYAKAALELGIPNPELAKFLRGIAARRN